MAVQRAALDIHIERVNELEAVGIQPPKDWTELHDRLKAYFGMQTPACDQLVDALITGDGEVTVLRAAAYSETAVQLSVQQRVMAAGHQRLADIYAPTAAENYRKIADRFSHAGDEFASAATLVDVDASAEQIVTGSEEQRVAWSTLPSLSARLDTLTTPLRAAAELCGVRTKSREAQHALQVDQSGVHRRAAWDAWFDTTGRTRHWGPIHKAGGQIRAANLDGFEEYRLCRPLETRQEQRGGLLVTTVVDPEDEGHAARTPTPLTVARRA